MPKEDHHTLCSALISTVSTQRATLQTKGHVHVDNAPGFQPLHSDKLLQQLHIELDFGRIKNPNQNPVAEKAVPELGAEILRYDPDLSQLTKEILSIVTSQLNSRIRYRGLSAWEIVHQRDQQTGQHLPFLDKQLAQAQVEHRLANQASSARHKAHGGDLAKEANGQCGSLVYITKEGDKYKPRNRYIVTTIDREIFTVQKFVHSQLRLKQYKVKPTEIFPVNSDMIKFYGPIRGLIGNESDNESEADIVNLPVNSLSGDNIPTPVNPPEYPANELHSQFCLPDQEQGDTDLPQEGHDAGISSSNQDQSSSHSGRPQRHHCKPAWMASGDY